MTQSILNSGGSNFGVCFTENGLRKKDNIKINQRTVVVYEKHGDTWRILQRDQKIRNMMKV